MQDKTISEMTMQPRDYSPAFAAWQQSARNVIYRPDHFEDPLFGIIEGRLAGTPCVFDKRLAFREGEVTMWAGQNGNGKSLLTGQVALQLLAAGQKVGIQSFEMTPARTLYRMLRQGWGRLPTKYDAQSNLKKIQAFLKYCRDAGLLLSNEKQAITIEGVLGVSVVMAKEFGCKHIFIDNLMKVVHAEDDYTGQKEFVQGCCQIARELSVHIHIVHHVRKGGSEKDEIDKFAVRGSSAIVDQIDNLVLIRRNLDKERLAEQRELTPTEDQDAADSLLRVSKQRNGDFMGLVPLWFDKRGTVFCTSPDRALPRLLPDSALPPDCLDGREI